MIIKHPAEPPPLLGGQVFSGGQQQPPVHPDGIGDHAAATEQIPGDALPDLGDHLVSGRDQVPLVHCDLGIRHSGADPGGIRHRRLEQSMKLVSHGSDRFQTIPSKIQRTDRDRVSSMSNGTAIAAFRHAVVRAGCR
jgi:hypothetical protein